MAFPTRSRPPVRQPRGIGLIEVLIAVLVLSFGLLALGALQAASIRAAAESRARTAGTFLAQEKLEELRVFAALLADADGDGVIDLIVDTDGDGIPDAPAPAFDQLSSGADDLDEITGGASGFRFDRTWSATPCRMNESGAVACGGPIGAAEANFMRIAVRVAWESVGGANATGEVVIEDSIGATSPLDAAVALSNPGRSRESPAVFLRPGFIQNTIPIAVGSDREVAATDPEPTIIRDNVVRTQFEVITVSNNENGDIRADRSFDYTVVGCNCRMDGVVPGKVSYGLSEWNGLTFTRPFKYTNGPTVSRTTATALNRNNDPPLVRELCTICCRDHHDSNSTDGMKTNPFRPAEDYLPNGNHNHYRPVLNGGIYTLVPANQPGDEYYESCRFIRRDGMFTLATDANLVNLVATSEDRLDEGTEQAAYAQFASAFVEAYVDRAVQPGSGYPHLPQTTVDAAYAGALAGLPTATRQMLEPSSPIGIPTRGLQMVSRGIYIDFMSPEVVRAIRCKQSGDQSSAQCLPYASRTKLELVPFFAINLTRLNTWRAVDPDVASVPLKDRRDPFSRGYAVAVGNGSTEVVAQSAAGNIGLTNHMPERPLHVGQFVEDRIPVVVSGNVPPPTTAFQVDFTVTSTNQTELSHPDVVAFAGADGNASCNQSGSQGPRAYWRCRLDSLGNGQVRVASYTGVVCVDRRGNTCYRQEPVRNRICVTPAPASLEAFPQPDVYLDYTDIRFNGSQGNPAAYTITVKRADQSC